MDRSDKAAGWVAEMLERQRGVLSTACAVGWVGWPGLRWRCDWAGCLLNLIGEDCVR